MVNICQKFTSCRNLRFGTNPDPAKSKTKCLIFSKRNVNPSKFKRIELDGNELPWVDSVKHLGHLLQTDNSMRRDIAIKRGAFIGKTNSLLQEFYGTSPSVLFKLLHSFGTNLYGSNLWDLFGKDCEKLYTSYNVAVRHILNIDRCSHRYILEPVSEALHLKVMLLSRFVSFHGSLIKSSKFPVRFLAKLYEEDLRTNHGKNLDQISRLCGTPIQMLTSKMVKSKLTYYPVPEDEKWRIPFCKELLQLRNDDNFNLPGFSFEEQTELLNYVCIS